MSRRHGVKVAQAEDALSDTERVVIDPDYASRTGRGVRVIGFSVSRGDVLTVIVVVAEGVEYGGSSWPANEKNQHIYWSKSEGDGQ